MKLTIGNSTGIEMVSIWHHRWDVKSFIIEISTIIM